MTTKHFRHQYSFSGADAKALAWFPQNPSGIRELDSVHTLSVSVHEAKGQARALGHRGIKGLARGVRTIAGSLIMTVVNDHPLRPLHDQYNEAFVTGGFAEPTQGWSIDRHRTGVGTFFNNYEYGNRLATLLPPFNLALQFVSEMSQVFDSANQQLAEDPELAFLVERAEGAGSMLVGVEFLDEGHVTSVSDIITEITFSFIACDYKPLAYFDTDAFIIPDDTDALDMTQHHAIMNDLFADPGSSGAEQSVTNATGALDVSSQRTINALLNKVKW